MKTCAQMLPALHLLAEGALEGTRAEEALEHCRSCPECSERLKEFQEIQNFLRVGLTREISLPDFVGAVLDSPPPPERRGFRFGLYLRYAGISFAAVILAFALVITGYLYARGFIGPKPVAGKLMYVSHSGEKWQEDMKTIRNLGVVVTGAGERRSLRLNNGVLVFLNEKTELTIQNLNSLKLKSGDIYIDTAGRKGTILRVLTRQGTTYVTGTKLGVSATKSKTAVVVEEGKVSVESSWEERVVVQGSVYTIIDSMQPEPPQTADMEEMFFWIQERAYLAGMIMDVLEARSESLFSDTRLRGGRKQETSTSGRGAGADSSEEAELLRQILQGLQRSREQINSGELIIDVNRTEYGIGHDLTEEEQKKFIEQVVAGQVAQLDPANPPDEARFKEIVQAAVDSALVKIEPKTSDRAERWVFEAPDRAKKQWLPDQNSKAVTEMIINGEFRYWPNRSLEHCSVGFRIEGTPNSSLHILPNPCYSGRSSLPIDELENPRIIGMEEIDGYPVYVVEADAKGFVTRTGKPIAAVQQLWVDPERGYIVLKARTYIGFAKHALQDCLETCAESFEEISPGFFYPRSFIRNMYMGDFVCGQKIIRKVSETVYTLREGRFDVRIPADEFEIPSNIPVVEVDREGRSISEMQRQEMEKRFREAEAEQYVKEIYDELERIRLYDSATAPDSHKLILNVSRERFGTVYRERGGIIYTEAAHEDIPVGVLILRVDPALAANSPVLPGDIIYTMNERPFMVNGMYRQLEQCIVLVNQGQPVTLGIRRKDKLLYLILWVD